jgi:hypothetical protein
MVSSVAGGSRDRRARKRRPLDRWRQGYQWPRQSDCERLQGLPAALWRAAAGNGLIGTETDLIN